MLNSKIHPTSDNIYAQPCGCEWEIHPIRTIMEFANLIHSTDSMTVEQLNNMPNYLPLSCEEVEWLCDNGYGI
jgi:hypothetical protein